MSTGDEEEFEQEEENEPSSIEPLRPDEDQLRQADLEQLKDYLQSLAYNYPEKQKKTVPDSSHLAQPLEKYLIGVDEFRDVLESPYRGMRIQRQTEHANYMTTEDLDAFIKKNRAHDEMKTKKKKKRGKVFLQILDKLEQQCRESAMRDLVDKFANYLAERCVKKHLPSVMTESFQRMTRGLVCNMYMSLGIIGNNVANKADHSIYETIAFVLADLIFESHFQLQIYPNIGNQFDYSNMPHESDHMLNCLKKRALHATRKLSRQRKKLDPDFKRFMEFEKRK